MIPHHISKWFDNVRLLPNGQYAGTRRMVYTTGLHVGIYSEGLYQRRYCYEHEHEAVLACRQWDGMGDPSGNWIVEKPGDRLGPGATYES